MGIPLHGTFQKAPEMSDFSRSQLHAAFPLQRQIQLACRHPLPLFLLRSRTVITVKQVFIKRTLPEILIGCHLPSLLLRIQPVALAAIQCCNRLRIELTIVHGLSFP